MSCRPYSIKIYGMTLELTLLILETVLLMATVVLLLMSLREGRGRNSLIREVGRAIKVLTRHEYFITVLDTMTDAKEEVAGIITGRMPEGEDRKRTGDVVRAIEKLAASGVRVRYLMPRLQDRLHVGWLYSNAGAEVHYSTCPFAHDLRYIVVDRNAVVIGMPEAIGEREATKKGYRLPSEGLAAILMESFAACWENTVPFREFLEDTLRQTGATPGVLARELKLEEKDLRKFLDG